jgi:hypothetical protein
VYDAPRAVPGADQELRRSPGGIRDRATDGQNVGSETSASAALGDLKKAHVRVRSSLRSPAYHAAALQNMASTTGGSYVEASSPADLRPCS